MSNTTNDASKQKAANYETFKKKKFQNLNISFVQSQSKLLAYICKLIVCLQVFLREG
jgi:hypothetical protein